MHYKTRKILTNIRDAIINPKSFFKKIVADGNMEESMLRAFIYGLIGGVLVLFFRLVGGATITIGSVFGALVIVPVLAVALLFIMGGLLMLISEITGGERDWEIAIKGLASVFFMYPVILVLNALAFNCTSLWIISIFVDVWMLYILYCLGVYCMRGNRLNVLIVVGILAVFMLTVYVSDYRIGWFMLKNAGATLACLL
ncbi:MAG: hypothetical protein IKP24_02870 [Alphaproteobacteria bacterium]|nr:hypothetical protein [Alphaproteobacteria bacterium]